MLYCVLCILRIWLSTTHLNHPPYFNFLANVRYSAGAHHEDDSGSSGAAGTGTAAAAEGIDNVEATTTSVADADGTVSSVPGLTVAAMIETGDSAKTVHLLAAFLGLASALEGGMEGP